MKFSVGSFDGEPERPEGRTGRARWAGAFALLLTWACAGNRAPQAAPFPAPLPEGQWPFQTAVWDARYTVPGGGSLSDRVWFSVEQGVREQIRQGDGPATNILRVGPYAYRWVEGQRTGIQGPAGRSPLGSVPDMRAILLALPFDLDRSHVTVGAIVDVSGVRCREIAFRYESRSILVPRGNLLRAGTVWIRLDRPFPMKVAMTSPTSYQMVIDHVVFDEPISAQVLQAPSDVRFRLFMPS